MMKTTRKWNPSLLSGLLVLSAYFTGAMAEAPALIDSDFEKTADAGEWPEGWPRNDNTTWEEEDGNGFLRMKSDTPGEMIMLYREIHIPEGTEALEFSWRQRVTGLERGENSWFDARIMMEWMDEGRDRVSPNPPTPNRGRDTDGWEERTLRFNVPEDARILKFMPSLFRVNAGTFDLDDVVLRPIPKLAPDEDPAQIRQRQHEEGVQNRRERAASRFEEHGDLLPNGGFEHDSNNNGVPDHWPRPGGDVSYVTEEGNTFLRITGDPGELSMQYRKIDLPPDVEALELSWRWRTTDLRPGAEPWFDARIMMNLLDGRDSKVGSPSAPYTRSSTGEWQERSRQFLVPEEAVALEFMPSLFRVRSGVLDLDDLSLRPVEPEQLLARQAEREAQRARMQVDPEDPQPENWPPELRVVGNRLEDPEGNEVWLQGLNIASLEWNPRGENVMKSAEVALEEWNVNVIRLPVKDEYWFGDGGDAYRELIDDVITYTANRGAYLVLDLHRYRAVRPEYRDFWEEAATRYKNHPAVLFDLVNEPHGTSWEVWRNGGYVQTQQEQADEDAFLSEEEKIANQMGFMSLGMQALVDTVRETGARNIIVAGGLDWAYDLSGILEGYALDEHEHGNGIMYSTHVYPWKSGWQRRFLDAAEKYPLFVGEVGADENKMSWMPEERQEDAETWAPDMMALMQKYRLNYAAWCFHPSASPRMLLDWDYTPTPFWGQIVKDAIAGKTFELQHGYR